MKMQDVQNLNEQSSIIVYCLIYFKKVILRVHFPTNLCQSTMLNSKMYPGPQQALFGEEKMEYSYM